MSDKIFIQKTELKKADAFRVNGPEDIPESLRDAIRVDKDGIHMECQEGAEVAPLGRVIRFEKVEPSENCPHGFNSWAISPEGEKKRFIEKDGAFFQKPVPSPAAPIGEDVPDWLKGADISQKRDGSFTIKTDWGESSGKPDEAYWVKYGTKADGKPDANILTKGTDSFDAYSVCTEDGKNICTLRQFDNKFTVMREKNPDVSYEDVLNQLKGSKGRGTEFGDLGDDSTARSLSLG